MKIDASICTQFPMLHCYLIVSSLSYHGLYIDTSRTLAPRLRHQCKYIMKPMSFCPTSRPRIRIFARTTIYRNHDHYIERSHNSRSVPGPPTRPPSLLRQCWWHSSALHGSKLVRLTNISTNSCALPSYSSSLPVQKNAKNLMANVC